MSKLMKWQTGGDKRFQGSKKKARKTAFLSRKQTKIEKKCKKAVLDAALETGDIELAANMMGIRLK